MIRVLYFARLREVLGRAEEVLDVTPHTVDDLRQKLQARGAAWASALDGKVLCAVNQTIAKGQTTLEDGDEVAFFPPVTGG